MPDRIIRDELLESERFAALTDNAHRCAFYACLLTADALGNMEAGPGRLLRLWTIYGLSTVQAIDETLAALAKTDLGRTYDVDGKRYLHIPRFRQSLRFATRIYPLSPWTTDEQKQYLAKNSRGEHQVITPSAHSAHPVRSVEVSRSEESRREVKRVAHTPSAPGETPNAQAGPRSFPPAGFFEKFKHGTATPEATTPPAALPPDPPPEPPAKPLAKPKANGTGKPKPALPAARSVAEIMRKDWQASKQGIAAMAAMLELRPAPGETFEQLRDRCAAKIGAQAKPAGG